VKKVFVFDLDSTLAELGKPIPRHVVSGLRKIEEAGHIVAVCSGKPTYYLCGMLRQVGLNFHVLIGENGAALQFGVDLPPEKCYRAHYDPNADRILRELRDIIQREADFQVWFQPNEVCLTPFYHTPREEAALEAIFAKYHDLIEAHLDCFKHCDSFDLTPKGVNKASGLIRLSELLSIPSDRFVAIGDGKNDYPMFRFAGASVGINVADEDAVDINFSSISQAMVYISTKML